MEDVKIKDTVMVYGYKATIEHIEEIQVGQSSPEKRKIYAARFSNRDGYTDGVYRKERVYTPEDGSMVVFCLRDSIRPFSETESACIRIQRVFRGYRARKEFHSFVSSLVWRKFEHLHENMTLHNHDEIYKPLIKVISEDIKNGKIQFTSKCFSSNSNQFSRISTTSYESNTYNENVPNLKGKIDKAFAMEIFHFFLTTKNYILPNNLVCKILTKTQKMLEENIKSSVIHVDMTKKSKDTKLIILGDVHGQLNDVLWLFNRFGLPSSNNIYIFNGDIADRGENATEIFLLLFVFKLSSYESVIINRGNHECSYMNEVYGFYNEVLSKYDSGIFDLFQGVFELLGLAVNIQNQIFVVHGGLSRYQDLTVQEIDELDRKKHEILHPDKYEDTVIFDLLWSDPQKKNGIGGNARGNNCITFGPDITDMFLRKNNFDILIRSHQVPKTLKGIESHHEGKCITLFSASNYCNKIKNLGAAIVFNQDLTFEVQEYMSPSLEVIRETFEENQKLREKVLNSSKILDLEKNVQRSNDKISAEGQMNDILNCLSTLICHEKNSLWSNLYMKDKDNTGKVHINIWREELEKLSGTKKVPWIYLCKKLKMIEGNQVHYNSILNRFKINYEPTQNFINTEWKSECFEHLYEALLKADLSLRETLMVFDKNLDGKVSFAEFEQVLKDLNIDLSNEQIRILVRLINSNSLCNRDRAQENDKIDVAEFIGKMRVCYRLAINKEYINNDKIRKLIETIGKHILADSADTANFHYRFYEENNERGGSERRKRSSVIKSVALFQKFKNYDHFGNGYLDYDDFVRAIKNFDMNKISKEVEFDVDDEILMELAKSIDITKSSKINFLEFLQAFYVVNKSKYSYVDEIWCHICTVIYENKVALKKCMKYLEDTMQGKITSIHFRYILMELNKILQEQKHEKKKPLTDEQIDLLSYTVETDDKIDYVDFLNSFKPVYYI
ncbi:serine/threonine protein phosphatase 7, putative [Plasmodium knowlesi strain H]|uniref:Serine/threonine-protein phosphatase n=3 Tax=Plasmodium knowlesi TaxID=5850 RepID=A0A5K1UMS1_PLAKH|nr:serine/threonine protein phosphatase 7, putative [Plasmodium knowlesi strain H]OTN67829.1 Serine/threonine-protein phosphatase [Plasmodium knowlesi]CAA9990378.1 serine/threonine protein phosphatase 7, putative [Plasmodium knowlesi strain H]SBO19584.1 serine/threonine protein phosphatase 7, putative [Plasmodium knowlesi strain H]SBO22659.1 serine/threonine protein phosphatase 7, putative [Plasmodium knowlesi strain H]VVS79852.1 serine/threonine protein phosphatase 7, putative [Plasmodium kno|eukprot:XP_002260778.1 PP1-like protein serine/threonine phosphatase [Plasmodium knowlesi strain H]